MNFGDVIESFIVHDEVALFGYKPLKRYTCSRVYITLYPNEEVILTPTYKNFKNFITDIHKLCDKYDLDPEEVLLWSQIHIPMTI